MTDLETTPRALLDADFSASPVSASAHDAIASSGALPLGLAIGP
jgi:hypothetical protein